jgi:hypothetical protein
MLQYSKSDEVRSLSVCYSPIYCLRQEQLMQRLAISEHLQTLRVGGIIVE